MTHGNANLVALTALRGPDAPTGDALVDAIYSGPKAALRPLHDRVIGLNLRDVEPAGRLERATGMCTHRVRLADPTEFDAEVADWLRGAYDHAG